MKPDPSAIYLLGVFVALSAVPVLPAQEPIPVFYESFDTGKEEGVVGRAGTFKPVDARGLVDFDRGTIAFFTRADKLEISEWAQIAGVRGRRNEGYWGMILGFDRRLEDFLFNFYDVGRYSPPMKFQPALGRWKPGEWHHLAAIWDRFEGMAMFEDGQRAASVWRKYSRDWNFVPSQLFVNGVVDELYIFAEPLAPAQILQLAQGEKPTGELLELASDEARRPGDLARMGWAEHERDCLPSVEAGKPQAFTFARFLGCVDAKRPVAQLFEGFAGSTWPLDKYGASLRGEHLDIHLAPGQSYDRVRAFVQRRFVGAFQRTGADCREEAVLPFEAPRPMIWHRRLEKTLSDAHLVLKRTTGWLGQLDFYRVEPMKGKPRETVAYWFSREQIFPDTELGRAFMGETPRRYWQPAYGRTLAADPWTLESPAFGGFQMTTEPLEEPKAFDGALVTLVAEGITEPTPVRVVLKEPVHSSRDWLVADAVLEPKGAGKQTFTLLLKGRPVINMPPTKAQKYLKDGKYSDETFDVPGVAFGLSVTAAHPVKWHMGKGGTSVAFCVTDRKAALPAAADDQVEFMREAYAELMEGHAYSDPLLVTPMKWLAMFAPERMEFRQMYERVGSPQWFVGINVPKLEYTPPANDTGAPEWAFWQMQAMQEHLRLVHWRIDEAQLPNGELGGVWNDDTTHAENWLCYAMAIDGDDGKIRNALRLFWDGLWKYQLEEGVGKYVQDACHFYEEGMGSMGMRLLVDYGDPVAYARALTTCSHYDKWMAPAEQGYVPRGEYMSVNTMWMAREFDDPRLSGHRADPLVPAGYLIWYNRHPAMAKLYRGFDAKDGFHGSANDRVTDFAAARKRYAEELLKPLDRSGPYTQLICLDEIGVTDEIRKAHSVEFKVPGPIQHYWGAKDTDLHYFHWKVSGDIRWLVESYKRVCEWFYSHDWLNSKAMPSLDRNPLPRYSLIRARIGSLAANRGSSGLRWPLYGLSYERGGQQIAALVTENLDTKLTARFYSFPEYPHDVQVRVWRLHPGAYKVTLSHDKNDDGQPEEAFWEQQMALDRGAYISFALPPQQCSILEITPIQTREPDYDKPDPAISRASCDYVYREHLVVHVYNNGTKPVENLVVRAYDGATGRIVVSGEQVIDRIDPPLDMKPRKKAVEFKNINANTYGSIVIELDPEGKIDDLNRHNNRAVVEY